MLKFVRILLVVLFFLALAGAAGLYYYNYTHEDTSPPAFRCDADLIEISVLDPEEALLQGLYAFDNVDGDLTSNIRVRNISALINDTDVTVDYIVFDEASNFATYTRTVRYTDYTPPRFRLKRPMIFNVGETVNFKDTVSVYDVRDGNISGRIKLEETTVVSNVPGTYSATLSVTNNMGDTVYLPLTIQVKDASISRPNITLTNYLIYQERGVRPQYRRLIKEVIDPLSSNTGHLVNHSYVSINASDVDISTPGVYEVYYFYTGVSGEVATVVLTLIVE